MNNDTIRLFFSGPLTLLFVLSSLATVILAAAGIGRAGMLTALGSRAAGRLEQARALPTLWGVSAGILILTGAAVLLKTPTVAWLGISVVAAGLVLTGLGVGAASFVTGRDLLHALGSETTDAPACLRTGLALFFYASFLPLLGWILVLLAAAAGIGAVLEALFTRPADEDPPDPG